MVRLSYPMAMITFRNTKFQNQNNSVNEALHSVHTITSERRRLLQLESLVPLSGANTCELTACMGSCKSHTNYASNGSQIERIKTHVPTETEHILESIFQLKAST